MQHIFIHGLGQTASSWEKTIDNIAEEIEIACPDLSEMLLDKETTYTNLYNEFSKYCEKYSQPLNICGLSLGGILALQYAIENPSKVNSLVLMGAQYKMPKTLLKLQNIIFHFMPKTMFKQMGFGKKDFIKLTKTMANLDFSKNLGSVKCPVLVICGEKDNANKKAAEELSKKIPNAKIKIIKDAGHEVNVDAPEKLAAVMIAFFD